MRFWAESLGDRPSRTLRREGVRTNALARPFPSEYAYPGQYKYKVIVGDKEFDIDHKLAEHLSRDVREGPRLLRRLFGRRC